MLWICPVNTIKKVYQRRTAPQCPSSKAVWNRFFLDREIVWQEMFSLEIAAVDTGVFFPQQQQIMHVQQAQAYPCEFSKHDHDDLQTQVQRLVEKEWTALLTSLPLLAWFTYWKKHPHFFQSFLFIIFFAFLVYCTTVFLITKQIIISTRLTALYIV